MALPWLRKIAISACMAVTQQYHAVPGVAAVHEVGLLGCLGWGGVGIGVGEHSVAVCAAMHAYVWRAHHGSSDTAQRLKVGYTAFDCFIFPSHSPRLHVGQKNSCTALLPPLVQPLSATDPRAIVHVPLSAGGGRTMPNKGSKDADVDKAVVMVRCTPI